MLDNNSLLEASLNFNFLSRMVEEKEKISIDEEINNAYSVYLEHVKDLTKKRLTQNVSLNLNVADDEIQMFVKQYFKERDYELIDLHLSKFTGNNHHFADLQISGRITTKKEYLKAINRCISVKCKLEDVDVPDVSFSFQLRELFGNCSTVVFNRINVESYDAEVLNLTNKENILYDMVGSLATNLARLAGFTRVLYSYSNRETNGRELFEEYLKNDEYKAIDVYNNKRGNNLITIYSKDLTK